MLNYDYFHAQLPPRPMGRYAHIITLRVTEGYALFQTDGELNRARIAAGVSDPTPMTRITLFKRKQTTPERLIGREMLRRYGYMEDTCVYNEGQCGYCADCVTYGNAVGETGSEKSKVYTDTAFSLTDYALSHEVFTLNAPYEDGTMTKQGDVTSRINSQDHVIPGTIFPAVITTRDLTANLFEYVLLNVLRTHRYGATTTRGGTMCNHIIGIALSDGEIFSNLHFTQRLFDELNKNGLVSDHSLINVGDAVDASTNLLPHLLAQDGVNETQMLYGDGLNTYLDGLLGLDADGLADLLRRASEDARAYFVTYVKKATKK